MQLPGMDRRKPLEKDARDWMTDLDSDQQQQQQQQQQSFLNSTSSSSCSFNHHLTKVTLPSSQQSQDPRKSLDASSSSRLQGRRGNKGIKLAKQKFLLEKAAKVASEVNKGLKEDQTSEMSSKSSLPLPQTSGVSKSSSSMSSTSQPSAQQTAATQPVVLLPSQSLHAQNPTSSSTTIDDFNIKSSSHGRLNNTFKHPLPHRPTQSSYFSSTISARSHRGQNDWAKGEYLYIKVCDLPDSITTRDLWAAFKHEGHIQHIRLWENAKGHRDGRASIKFKYGSDLDPFSTQCND